MDAVAINGFLYMGNGISQIRKSDGVAVYVDVPTGPSTAPTAAAGSATGLTGTYLYRVTFVAQDTITESAPSPVSNSVTVTNQKIDLSSIPQPAAGDNATGIRIYRNMDGGTDLFLVATISVGTTVYTDNIADGSLGAALTDPTEDQTRFPPAKFLEVYHNRLCGASGNILLLSNENEPHVCPESTNPDVAEHGIRIVVKDARNSPITGLKTHGNGLYVFTGLETFVLQGTTSEDFLLDHLTSRGCVAHRTIVSAEDSLFWLSTDGVYMGTTGQAIRRISDDVRQTIEGMTPAQASGACGYFFDNKYYLTWSDGCLWFDIRSGKWGRYTNWTYRQVALTPIVGANRPRLYGARFAEGRVHQLETGGLDHDTAITATWASRDTDIGMSPRWKRIHLLGVVFNADGSGNVTVNLYKDTGSSSIQTVTHNLANPYATGGTISRLLEPATFQAVGEFFKLEISTSTTAAKFEITDATLSWTLYM